MTSRGKPATATTTTTAAAAASTSQKPAVSKQQSKLSVLDHNDKPNIPSLPEKVSKPLDTRAPAAKNAASLLPPSTTAAPSAAFSPGKPGVLSKSASVVSTTPTTPKDSVKPKMPMVLDKPPLSKMPSIVEDKHSVNTKPAQFSKTPSSIDNKLKPTTTNDRPPLSKTPSAIDNKLKPTTTNDKPQLSKTPSAIDDKLKPTTTNDKPPLSKTPSAIDNKLTPNNNTEKQPTPLAKTPNTVEKPILLKTSSVIDNKTNLASSTGPGKAKLAVEPVVSETVLKKVESASTTPKKAVAKEKEPVGIKPPIDKSSPGTAASLKVDKTAPGTATSSLSSKRGLEDVPPLPNRSLAKTSFEKSAETPVKKSGSGGSYKPVPDSGSGAVAKRAAVASTKKPSAVGFTDKERQATSVPSGKQGVKTLPQEKSGPQNATIKKPLTTPNLRSSAKDSDKKPETGATKSTSGTISASAAAAAALAAAAVYRVKTDTIVSAVSEIDPDTTTDDSQPAPTKIPSPSASMSSNLANKDTSSGSSRDLTSGSQIPRPKLKSAQDEPLVSLTSEEIEREALEIMSMVAVEKEIEKEEASRKNSVSSKVEGASSIGLVHAKSESSLKSNVGTGTPGDISAEKEYRRQSEEKDSSKKPTPADAGNSESRNLATDSKKTDVAAKGEESPQIVLLESNSSSESSASNHQSLSSVNIDTSQTAKTSVKSGKTLPSSSNSSLDSVKTKSSQNSAAKRKIESSTINSSASLPEDTKKVQSTKPKGKIPAANAERNRSMSETVVNGQPKAVKAGGERNRTISESPNALKSSVAPAKAKSSESSDKKSKESNAKKAVSSVDNKKAPSTKPNTKMAAASPKATSKERTRSASESVVDVPSKSEKASAERVRTKSASSAKGAPSLVTVEEENVDDVETKADPRPAKKPSTAENQSKPGTAKNSSTVDNSLSKPGTAKKSSSADMPSNPEGTSKTSSTGSPLGSSEVSAKSPMEKAPKTGTKQNTVTVNKSRLRPIDDPKKSEQAKKASSKAVPATSKSPSKEKNGKAGIPAAATSKSSLDSEKKTSVASLTPSSESNSSKTPPEKSKDGIGAAAPKKMEIKPVIPKPKSSSVPPIDRKSAAGTRKRVKSESPQKNMEIPPKSGKEQLKGSKGNLSKIRDADRDVSIDDSKTKPSLSTSQEQLSGSKSGLNKLKDANDKGSDISNSSSTLASDGETRKRRSSLKRAETPKMTEDGKGATKSATSGSKSKSKSTIPVSVGLETVPSSNTAGTGAEKPTDETVMQADAQDKGVIPVLKQSLSQIPLPTPATAIAVVKLVRDDAEDVGMHAMGLSTPAHISLKDLPSPIPPPRPPKFSSDFDLRNFSSPPLILIPSHPQPPPPDSTGGSRIPLKPRYPVVYEESPPLPPNYFNRETDENRGVTWDNDSRGNVRTYSRQRARTFDVSEADYIEGMRRRAASERPHITQHVSPSPAPNHSKRYEQEPYFYESQWEDDDYFDSYRSAASRIPYRYNHYQDMYDDLQEEQDYYRRSYPDLSFRENRFRREYPPSDYYNWPSRHNSRSRHYNDESSYLNHSKSMPEHLHRPTDVYDDIELPPIPPKISENYIQIPSYKDDTEPKQREFIKEGSRGVLEIPVSQLDQMQQGKSESDNVAAHIEKIRDHEVSEALTGSKSMQPKPGNYLSKFLERKNHGGTEQGVIKLAKQSSALLDLPTDTAAPFAMTGKKSTSRVKSRPPLDDLYKERVSQHAKLTGQTARQRRDTSDYELPPLRNDQLRSESRQRKHDSYSRIKRSLDDADIYHSSPRSPMSNEEEEEEEISDDFPRKSYSRRRLKPAPVMASQQNSEDLDEWNSQNRKAPSNQFTAKKSTVHSAKKGTSTALVKKNKQTSSNAASMPPSLPLYGYPQNLASMWSANTMQPGLSSVNLDQNMPTPSYLQNSMPALLTALSGAIPTFVQMQQTQNTDSNGLGGGGNNSFNRGPNNLMPAKIKMTQVPVMTMRPAFVIETAQGTSTSMPNISSASYSAVPGVEQMGIPFTGMEMTRAGEGNGGTGNTQQIQQMLSAWPYSQMMSPFNQFMPFPGSFPPNLLSNYGPSFNGPLYGTQAQEAPKIRGAKDKGADKGKSRKPAAKLKGTSSRFS